MEQKRSEKKDIFKNCPKEENNKKMRKKRK